MDGSLVAVFRVCDGGLGSLGQSVLLERSNSVPALPDSPRRRAVVPVLCVLQNQLLYLVSAPRGLSGVVFAISLSVCS